MNEKLRLIPCALVLAITSIVDGCSSENYSRMCRTTDSPYTQVFACQPYYASDEGQWFLKQREKREAEWAKVYDSCMHEAKSYWIRRTKADCVDLANKLVPQGVIEPR